VLPEVRDAVRELKRILTIQKLTQSYAAAQLNVSQASLSNLLAGRKAPSLAVWFEIQRFLSRHRTALAAPTVETPDPEDDLSDFGFF
jgi:transcriptional regulator with XRE-family HTH domain